MKVFFPTVHNYRLESIMPLAQHNRQYSINSFIILMSVNIFKEC